MASDSSSSSPLLTPDSTGTGNSLHVPPSPAKSTSSSKDTRRQAAFYPNMNSSNKPQKPFSRSAAKRGSVMALGSIEHLQHYFTKTGIAAKKNPLDKPHHGLVPAIGGKLHVPSVPSLGGIDELPPSPVIPSPPRPVFSPHVRTWEADPEEMLPRAIEDIQAVASAWKLEGGDTQGDLNATLDLLDVFKMTTRAIRSTRNYLLSLPDESTGTIRAQFKPKITTPAPIATASLLNGASSSSLPQQQLDPIALIRRSALEVLTVLRQLEETCRLPLSDDAYDAQSDGAHSRGTNSNSPANTSVSLPSGGDNVVTLAVATSDNIDPDASMAFSLVQVNGRYEHVLVWEEEDDGWDDEPDEKKQDRWDERLVLGNGWLYRQDIRLSDLEKERNVVGQYLDVVDEVLFSSDGKVDGEGRGERGWQRVRKKREGRASSRAAKRRVSTGDTEGRGLGFNLLDSGRRRVSTGTMGTMGVGSMMRGMTLSEEPQEMQGIHEEGNEDEQDQEEQIDDEDLPDWAKRGLFLDDELSRAHVLLLFFLPPQLRPMLGDPTSRSTFLNSISSGQLLCMAYNACIRKSQKPWGFVSKDGIHDIIALEKTPTENGGEEEKAKQKKVWTFRRTDNLRLWAGALKLRYMLPIRLPSQPIASGVPSKGASSLAAAMTTSNRLSSATSNHSSTVNTPLSSPGVLSTNFTFPNTLPNDSGSVRDKKQRDPPIVFDARVVAKKEEGWERMLEVLLLRWVEKAVEERRLLH